MALTLTFLISFYRKYIENEKENVQLLNFGAFARNLIFVWAHLTNHCNKSQLIKNINSIIHSNGFFIFSLFHSFRFTPRVADCRWSLVFDNGCFGQRLRWMPTLVHVR